MDQKKKEALLGTLRNRFEQNTRRHPDVSWSTIQSRLASRPEKLEALLAMEASGGEPDLVSLRSGQDEYLFIDCSAESPAGRRSL